MGPECWSRYKYSLYLAQRQRWAEEKLARQAKEAAINAIILKLEGSAVLTQPQLVPLLEATRQVYNHRDFLYEILLEVKSKDTLANKVDGLAISSLKEMRDELSNRLLIGGISVISSEMKQAGWFKQPFGVKETPLDDITAKICQSFFEGTLTTLIQGRG